MELRNFIKDDRVDNDDLWPVRMGYHHVRPNHPFHLRMIEYYGLHFVVSGKHTLAYGDHEYELSAGDAYCIYPEVLYRPVQTDRSYELVWISLNGARVPSLLALAQFSPAAPFVRNVISMDMEKLLRGLFSKPHEDDSQSKVELYGAIYRLFSLLIPKEDKSKTKPSPDQWIQRGLDYMNTHFTEHIQVQDVADYVNVHRVHFTNVFTKHVGMPPIQYLQKLRMERALHLLQHTTRTVTEIALSLGYPELYAFTRAFSNYYGASPSTYR
ncbi:MAG: AraC family transcriptional regulator [Paenibacillus sp.]|nr:AraC family transcriptional regulator [Paenibacillus sp.]